MGTTMYRICLPLVFKAGLSPGEYSDGNRLLIARDGLGRPVLRGTALAGVLRHAWRELRPELTLAQESAIFGARQGAEDAMLAPSRVEVADCVIDMPGGDGSGPRVHNHINRHTGVVIKGSLFSVESVPPGALVTAVLWLLAGEEQRDAAALWMADLGEILAEGLILGGRSARGIGLASLAGEPTRRAYDLAVPADYACYLDDHRLWRQGETGGLSVGQPLPASGDKAKATTLCIDLELYVPRGQDFLVAAAESRDSGAAPQTVFCEKGQFWLLPGSSLRGLFRAWVSRLAAREGLPVAFSRERQFAVGADGGAVTGEQIGWCFSEKEEDNDSQPTTDCPVAALFGWLGHRGRIHVSDSMAPVDTGLVQRRSHVAIDLVTGGALEGRFFQNDVIVGDVRKPVRFTVRILVRNPTQIEARWVAACLGALDSGLIRVGSSKAAGRLALCGAPAASGPFQDVFDQVKPLSPLSPLGAGHIGNARKS